MHVDVPALVQAYGYPATFLGSVLEGETVLILAGLAVHRGHLALPLVWLLAALGGMTGDAFYFALGRRYGSALLARFPRFAPVVGRIDRLVARGPAMAIVGVRFMYGVRMAGPAVIGSGPMPWRTFLCWNALGALLWSGVWLFAGYMLGEAAQRLLGNLAHVERELFAAVIVAGGIAAFVVRFLRRKSAAASAR